MSNNDWTLSTSGPPTPTRSPSYGPQKMMKGDDSAVRTDIVDSLSERSVLLSTPPSSPGMSAASCAGAESSFPVTSGMPFTAHRSSDTRNLAIDNLPIDVTLSGLWSILEPFGEIRHLFRPKLGLYSGAVVMFYSLTDAVAAYNALRNSAIAGAKVIVYFVNIEDLQNLLESEPALGDGNVVRYLQNQGKLVLVGFVYRDDSAVEGMLASWGTIRSFYEFTQYDQICYTVEYLDVRAAEAAYHALHGANIMGSYLRVAYVGWQPSPQPHPISYLPDMTSPLLYGPLHDFNNTATHFTPAHPKDRFPVATHHLASTGALDSYYPVGPGRGYEMGQDRRRRQEGLKIDTSLASARPTPRRIASASCVMTHAAAFTPQLPPRRAHKGDHGPRSYVSNRSPMQNSGNNELNLYNIAMGYDTRTTFMIRNIPNKYTQRMLIEFLNRTHKGEYDFLYLRMDFKNRCNVGYAFINFVSSAAVLSFAERVVGKKWSKFNSDKVCTLSYANLQGKEALVQKFRNSSVMLEDPSYRPKVFFTTGPNRGEEQPFPPPTTAIRPRSEVLFSRDNAGQPHKVVRPPSPANGAVASPLLVHEPLLRHVSPSVSRAGSPNQLDTGLRAPTEMPLLPPGLQSNLERNIFGESGSNETYSPHSSFSLDDLDLSRLTLSDDWTPYPAVASDIENTGFSS